jgi:hypothetical protein
MTAIPKFETTTETLDAILRAAAKLGHERQQQPFRYRFSSAGDHCKRKLVFAAQDEADGLPSPEQAPTIKRVIQAAVGNAVGAMLEEGAKAIGLETQKVVTADGATVKITGALDILRPGLLVVDVKTVSDPAWSRLRYGPQEKHVVQVNGYAVYEHVPRWALWYIRLSDAFRKTKDNTIGQRLFEGDADPAAAHRDIVGTWEDVDAHVAMGTVPPIPEEFLRDQFPCGWSTGACAYYGRCWSVASQQPLVQLGAPAPIEVEAEVQDNDAAEAA